MKWRCSRTLYRAGAADHRQWDRLADSDRQRREFIANISHDLRTPLTSLLGYLETLTLKDERLTPRSAAVSHHRPAPGQQSAPSLAAAV
jgi:signal transduction histidine kinase